MQLQGQQTFDASPEIIWETALKPEVLEACIPGAQSVEETEDGVYDAVVKRGLAAVTVNMDIRAEVVEDDRPESMTLSLEGSDNRINSAVDGEALIEIEEGDDGSVLTYDAELNFSGKLASLGSRLIKRAVNKDLKTLFSNLEEYISEEQAAAGN